MRNRRGLKFRNLRIAIRGYPSLPSCGTTRLLTLPCKPLISNTTGHHNQHPFLPTRTQTICVKLVYIQQVTGQQYNSLLIGSQLRSDLNPSHKTSAPKFQKSTFPNFRNIKIPTFRKSNLPKFRIFLKSKLLKLCNPASAAECGGQHPATSPLPPHFQLTLIHSPPTPPFFANSPSCAQVCDPDL